MIVLRPSKIEGVGCFTMAPIKKGEVADIWDATDCKFVPEAEADERVDLCETYCVATTGGYYCPLDFRRMSVGWYLNHSDTPNLASNDKDVYFAIRDIAAGEELTIDYAQLDENVDNRIDK